jgi:lysozyme
MDLKKFVKQLRIHEGVENGVYWDTTGHRTVGVGFNLERMDAPEILEEMGISHNDVVTGERRLTDEEIDQLLMRDVEDFEKEIRKLIPVYDELDEVRQRVVMDMLFNLGYKGFKGFKNTRKYINAGRYDLAARNMMLSLWAKQVKSRAVNLSKMMKHGEDVYEL